MMYVFGLLTGITLCIFIAILFKKNEVAITRTINQTGSKLKSKGNIIEPDGEDFEDWLKNLEE